MLFSSWKADKEDEKGFDGRHSTPCVFFLLFGFICCIMENSIRSSLAVRLLSSNLLRGGKSVDGNAHLRTETTYSDPTSFLYVSLHIDVFLK